MTMDQNTHSPSKTHAQRKEEGKEQMYKPVVIADFYSWPGVTLVIISMIAIIGVTMQVGSYAEPEPRVQYKGPYNCPTSIYSVVTRNDIMNGPCQYLNLTATGSYIIYLPKDYMNSHWMEIKATPQPGDWKTEPSGTQTFDIEYDILVYELDENFDHTDTTPIKSKNDTAKFYCRHGSTKDIKGDLQRHVSCSQTKMFEVAELQRNNHLIEINFKNVNEIKEMMPGMLFEVSIQNPFYNMFMVTYRYILNIILVLVTCVFLISLRKSNTWFIDFNDLIFEQAYLLLVGFATFHYNDIMASINLIEPMPFSFVIVSIEAGFYYFVIILFWLVMFERISYEATSQMTFSLTVGKYLFSGAISIMITFATAVYSLFYLQDPGYNISGRYPVICTVFMVLTACMMICLVGYLIYCLIIYSQYVRYAPNRHNFFYFITALYIPVHLFFLTFGLFNYYNSSKACFTGYLTANNLYYFVMVALYSPVGSGVVEQLKKQGPEVSGVQGALPEDGIQLPDVSTSYIDGRFVPDSALDESRNEQESSHSTPQKLDRQITEEDEEGQSSSNKKIPLQFDDEIDPKGESSLQFGKVEIIYQEDVVNQCMKINYLIKMIKYRISVG